MNKAGFMLYRIALIVVGCLLTLWSVSNEEYILLPIWVVVGTSLLFFLRGKVKEVIADERSDQIKAVTAKTTIQVFIITAALATAVLVLLGKNLSSESLIRVGTTVGYSVLALLVIYWVTYMFYVKKY